MKYADRLSGFLFLLLILLIWEFAARTEIFISAIYLPPVSTVVATLLAEETRQSVLAATGQTLTKAYLGLLLAAVVSIPLGMVIGLSALVRRTSTLFLEMLRPLPPIAVIPIAIIFLGIGMRMQIAVVAFACVWPILINTVEGVRRLDSTLIDTAKTLQISGSIYLREVVFWGALPVIAAGIRISLALALMVAVAAEMLVGSSGLGFLLIDAQRGFAFALMYGALFVLAVIGYLSNVIYTALIDTFILRWYPVPQTTV